MLFTQWNYAVFLINLYNVCSISYLFIVVFVLLLVLISSVRFSFSLFFFFYACISFFCDIDSGENVYHGKKIKKNLLKARITTSVFGHIAHPYSKLGHWLHFY